MSPFDIFAQSRRADLKRIARHTRGEHSLDDVINEAWLMADTLSNRLNAPADFLLDTFQQTLLSHLYQHLVRYTELNVRCAVRLDHAPDTESTGRQRTLIDTLACDGLDPLGYLVAHEDAESSTPSPGAHHCLATAYLLLLARFRSILGLARHLNISSSWTYRRLARAASLAERQLALPLPPAATLAELRPWRSHRQPRRPTQLEFDFSERFTLHLRQPWPAFANA